MCPTIFLLFSLGGLLNIIEAIFLTSGIRTSCFVGSISFRSDLPHHNQISIDCIGGCLGILKVRSILGGCNLVRSSKSETRILLIVLCTIELYTGSWVRIYPRKVMSRKEWYSSVSVVTLHYFLRSFIRCITYRRGVYFSSI